MTAGCCCRFPACSRSLAASCGSQVLQRYGKAGFPRDILGSALSAAISIEEGTCTKRKRGGSSRDSSRPQLPYLRRYSRARLGTIRIAQGQHGFIAPPPLHCASLAWLAASPAAAADAAFTQWLAALWPQAHEAGVSRATFDLATRALEPDLSLPDLDLPGSR